MSENQLNKEDQLFIHLVNTFVQSAWISLGKVKNPVSDELERNLEQLRALENKMSIHVGYIDSCPLSVDTEEDLIEIRNIMEKNDKK